jgi:hypothetical protein
MGWSYNTDQLCGVVISLIYFNGVRSVKNKFIRVKKQRVSEGNIMI